MVHMVKRMTKALKTSTSGYYEWLKNGRKTKRDMEDEKYLSFIRIEFNKSRQTYGPRRLSKVLQQTYKLLTDIMKDAVFAKILFMEKQNLLTTIFQSYTISSRMSR